MIVRIRVSDLSRPNRSPGRTKLSTKVGAQLESMILGPNFGMMLHCATVARPRE